PTTTPPPSSPHSTGSVPAAALSSWKLTPATARAATGSATSGPAVRLRSSGGPSSASVSASTRPRRTPGRPRPTLSGGAATVTSGRGPSGSVAAGSGPGPT